MFRFERAMKAVGISFFVLLFCFHMPVGAETDFESNKKLAEQGHAKAQFRLGLDYDYGQGVSRDHKEAFKWYKKSAMQGHAGAQYKLSELYALGRGIPINYIKAYIWASVSKASGFGNLEESIDWLHSQMTPEQIAQAQQEATVLWEEIKKRSKAE